MPEAATAFEQILSARREAGKAVVDVDEPAVKLVVFTLQDQAFAFPAANIREILADAAVFFVPGCPPDLEGVINVRGDIESVIGLALLLGLPAAAPAAGSLILIGRHQGMTSGIRVDRVLDLPDLPRTALQPPPPVMPEPVRRLALGVFSHCGRPVTLLDAGRLFEEYARDRD
jgi:purine-binding chemotaxis protein CheW